MFKKVMVVAIIAGLSTFVNAGGNTRSISETSEAFVGLEVGSTELQGDTSFYGENHDGSAVSIGLRLGAQNNKWRSMVVLDYFDSEDDGQNYERAMLQVDYYVMAANFSTVAFRPYVGLNGGYANYEGDSIDENGFTYGGQVGFTADVSNAVDLDIAYRYSVTSFDELDHVGNFIVGINYLY